MSRRILANLTKLTYPRPARGRPRQLLRFARRHCEHSRTFAVVLANLRGSQ